MKTRLRAGLSGDTALILRNRLECGRRLPGRLLCIQEDVSALPGLRIC